VSRCFVLCAFALSSCSLLFDSTEGEDSSRGEEDLEFMVAIDGDPDTQGYELYVARTVEGVSFIEHYAPTATPTLLEGRFDLPIRPTAMTRSKASFPSVLLMGTGDADEDGTRETEFINRLDWTNVPAGISDASFATQFPYALGPALPGLNSRVQANVIVPDNSQFYTTGLDVVLVSSVGGWDALQIDPEPLLSFDEPIRCIEGHGLGLNAHEMTFFAGSTLAIVDTNTQQSGDTLHDIEQRVQEMPFVMKDCAYNRYPSKPTYMVTDGSSLHAIQLDPDGFVAGSVPLPGDAPAHDRVVDINLLDFENDGDPEIVVIVADPPTIYLGIDMSVRDDSIQFSAPMVAQPLDWTPTAALGLSNGAENSDRLYVSESKAAPRCFQLGISTSGFEPELIPCEP
jgi:hypothetical protein